MELKVHEKDKAPDFSLPDQEGVEHSLGQYLGNWVLLYFYPKDDTPGCTTEACELRDNFPDLKDLGVVVLGVSKDSVASHKKFAKKHELPFTLLADENKDVLEMYGVWQKKTMRTSFLIDPQGVVAKFYKNVKPKVHAQEVLSDVGSLRQ